MKTRDFFFELPEELIAQEPPKERGASRLFVLDPGAAPGTGTGCKWDHKTVTDLPGLMAPGTVMVFNDSKVRRARLEGTTSHGGRVEVLVLEDRGSGSWACLTNRNKKLKAGDRLTFPSGNPGVPEAVDFLQTGTVGEREGDLRLITFSPPLTEDYLETWGHIPLPPYMKRPDGESDRERYQTVYAGPVGSAAAPTAGLHFTPSLLESLKARGVEVCFVTLHVGLGTFLPVRAEELEDHRMHKEIYTIPSGTAEAVNRAKKEGRPVLAVGTTSLRTLESAADPEGFIAPGDGDTSIFIYPGYRFRCADMLFTNFHTPESTLLMLVSAFAGTEEITAAYKEAINLRYRFFSYGDAMLIRGKTPGSDL